MEQYSYVYIVTNKKNGTLYIGITSNLIKRVWEHKNKATEGFTNKHGCTRLVYYEQHSDILEAIKREKRLKKYLRAWKINLIESINPKWDDLYVDICS
ncbi:GIY-YIG nuclease family protein [Legionella bononiensis]|uniref:GIY-YIG nuclease family protein n=1 Tax=Legionella bononiensis TaxID=2793102 RepID=A0ABS1W9L5_9GAMM|nr:GIY-YIG nuclease family protein [Legionella bononiensis]MBL7480753.1 GIY-YIG nuclease family protein [Legionella bononiensis]MBL7526048.1 GIY-YIG nuclease family protein [Legionella bononiensis]MBL7563457.1 GIY-YIG nuclease family protein [Legionella bononiensis]